MQDLLSVQYSFLIPLLPLVAAAVAGFFGARWLKGASHWPVWIALGIGAVVSFTLLGNMLTQIGAHEATSIKRHIYTWIEAGAFRADVGFFLDPLTIIMLCIVTGIGLLIAIFSAGYMAGEAGYFRFFAYIGMFIFSMTCVIMGENLILLYLGWEAVGLCSYLLIGYYYERPAAREAAKKAFLVNRVGDFGFALGIMLTYLAFGTISYFGDGVGTGTGFLEMAYMIAMGQMQGTDLQHLAIDWVPFLLMAGAFGKSAQFPLYVWLPDAMEGPTPVSALIHAATMVTSGVYMIVRCSPLYLATPAAMNTLAVIAAFTALFAASIALRQFDLKKVFAFSTVSQLGLMFVGVAALAPVAGMFHLINHAFFKALLFLSSGVVMHAMLGELDLRKMSGLKRVLPKTRWCMLIGCLALGGIIPFSGFWSKDEIIIAAFARQPILGLAMLVMAVMTAYYAFRVYFRVFEGPLVLPEAPADAHHPAPHAPHAAASAVAVQLGAENESGVDEHLMKPEHHAQTAATHAHGHDDRHHNHEPLIMMLPLLLLAIGAAAAGLLNVPGHWLGDFLGQSPSLQMGMDVAYRSGFYPDPAMWGQHLEHHLEADWHIFVMVASIVVALFGVFLAYVMHLKDRGRPERFAARVPQLARLLEARYWIDEVYQAAIVEPLRRLGGAFFWLDRVIVDGLVWAIGFAPMVSGAALRLATQRGYLQGYAVLMLLCLAAILLVIFL